MTSGQLDEERIFHIARQIPVPEARDGYLDRICAGDQALRERVEALLEVHEKEKDFLKSSPEPAPTVDHTSLTECPGATIGRYKLMEQIGEGGMGTVFVAEQEQPIRRKVALKVIKPGMDSKAVVARFEAERQALAMMDHPNIAKVLDAGTTDSGRPYFAMELVKGIPITEYCDRNKLAIRERLDLFIQVCQAIQHAHQKGIIHRDIKPSNVLVTLHDGKPVPKVIDFGVAKALNARLTDKTIYTEHLQIVGTLLYMSPEQAELSGLDVDTRSDVYSLGVLLYELLTGTTPFQKAELDQAGFDEQRRIIRETDPPRASQRISSLGETATAVAEHRKTDPKKLHQAVRGDLDWIVANALEKDRTRRYDAATSLADDIQRYLNDEPIEARPPSRSYQIGKFAKRHAGLLGLTIVITTVMACGIVGITWYALKSDRLLKDLQDEMYHRYFYTAILNESLENDLVRRAEMVELPREKLDVLRGLRAFYRGHMDEAIKDLSKGEQSVASIAVNAYAQVANGDHTAAASSFVALKDATPVTPEDGLMLGQLYSVVRPVEARDHIKIAVRGGNSDIMGEVLLATANVNIGGLNDDLDFIARNVQIVKAANTIYPKKRFIQENLILACLVAARSANRQEHSELSEAYLSQANEIADGPDRTASSRTYWEGTLFAYQGRFVKSLESYEASFKTNPTYQVYDYAAVALLCDQSKRAIAFLDACPDHFYTRIGLGMFYAQDPARRNVVREIFEKTVAEKSDCDARILVLRMLLMAGVEDELVAEKAAKLLPDSVELILPYMAHLEYLANPDPCDYQDLLDSSPRLGYFDVGLRFFNAGEYSTAKTHFKRARDSVFLDPWWCDYYLREIEQRELQFSRREREGSAARKDESAP